MGYMTSYTLTIADDHDESIMRQLREENESANYALTESGELQNGCKWYHHADELKEFSKKHPNTLFTLHGDGEENGDIWDKHFLNGKMQTCIATITLEKYDPNKLE